MCRVAAPPKAARPTLPPERSADAGRCVQAPERRASVPPRRPRVARAVPPIHLARRPPAVVSCGRSRNACQRFPDGRRRHVRRHIGVSLTGGAAPARVAVSNANGAAGFGFAPDAPTARHGWRGGRRLGRSRPWSRNHQPCCIVDELGHRDERRAVFDVPHVQATDAHDVARLERAFRRPSAVDVDAVPAAEIAHDDIVAGNRKFGVSAGQQRIRFAQIAGRIPADHDLADDQQLALPAAVGHDQLSTHVPPSLRHSAAARFLSDEGGSGSAGGSTLMPPRCSVKSICSAAAARARAAPASIFNASSDASSAL